MPTLRAVINYKYVLNKPDFTFLLKSLPLILLLLLPFFLSLSLSLLSPCFSFVFVLFLIFVLVFVRVDHGVFVLALFLVLALSLIQPINMKLGTCNKCPVYFQLSIVTWHLIGFHGNNSNIMTSLVAAILDFQIFNFFSYSSLNTENSKKKTFSDWNLQNYKIHCKVISI